jgi:Ca2+-dependent lipid-binding protein
VTVLEAKDLPLEKGFFKSSKPDTYVSIKVDEKKKKTKVQKQTMMPRWSESFKLYAQLGDSPYPSVRDL